MGCSIETNILRYNSQHSNLSTSTMSRDILRLPAEDGKVALRILPVGCIPKREYCHCIVLYASAPHAIPAMPQWNGLAHLRRTPVLSSSPPNRSVLQPGGKKKRGGVSSSGRAIRQFLHAIHSCPTASAAWLNASEVKEVALLQHAVWDHTYDTESAQQ